MARRATALKPIPQIQLKTFVDRVADPGQRYRAKIGNGRLIEIEGGQVHTDRLSTGASCLTMNQKRIVAIAPAGPALLKAIAEITGKDPQ
jgi:hypothetical protein